MSNAIAGDNTLDEAQAIVREANQESAHSLLESLEAILKPSLRDHATAIDEAARTSADRLERQWQRWQESINHHSESIVAQQQSVVHQFETLADTQRGTESILALQQSLDANLQRLNATNAAIDRSISAAAGDGMAEAMRFLARAVDVLAKNLPDQELLQEASRRAA